jgi:hypothetical protein
MDQKEPGLIDELIAGAEGDFDASKLQDNLPSAVPIIFREAIAMLTRAKSYRLNSSDLLRGDEG